MLNKTPSPTSEPDRNAIKLSVLHDNRVWCFKISSWGSQATETLLLKYASWRSTASVWPALLSTISGVTQQQPQWNSALGSSRNAARLRLLGRQSKWYQASQSSHCTHCTVSCCGKRQRAAAHGSMPCATLLSSSFSSSSSEEDDVEDDDDELDDEEEEEAAGDGREGWGGGCFLGLPRRLLQR